MRRSFVTVLFAYLAILQPGVVAAAPSQDQVGYASRVYELTNAERQKYGLTPLMPSAPLEQAAQAYSQVLASDACFAHTCGPVPNIVDRDGLAGYSGWTSIGENIAAGYQTPEAVIAGWMASPGHRANILSPNYTETGIGIATGAGQFGTYWTQEFGARGAATDSGAGEDTGSAG